MVAHGAGGAILPRVIAERYRQRYSFAVIGLQDRWAQRRLCLCYGMTPACRQRCAAYWNGFVSLENISDSVTFHARYCY